MVQCFSVASKWLAIVVVIGIAVTAANADFFVFKTEYGGPTPTSQYRTTLEIWDSTLQPMPDYVPIPPEWHDGDDYVYVDMESPYSYYDENILMWHHIYGYHYEDLESGKMYRAAIEMWNGTSWQFIEYKTHTEP